MTTAADPCVNLESKVNRRVHDDESHRIVAGALTKVAIAALHPARHLGVGRSASRGMLEDAIESATRAAMDTLVDRLDGLVETLPRATIDELADEQTLAEHGLE